MENLLARSWLGDQSLPVNIQNLRSSPEVAPEPGMKAVMWGALWSDKAWRVFQSRLFCSLVELTAFHTVRTTILEVVELCRLC